MILSQTPYAITFLGDATDYPEWYRENPGAVLAASIDKYCWVMCRARPPFFEERHRIAYEQIELVNEIQEIQHPIVRECLKFMNYDDSEGIEVQHNGDLPARTGMGTSSSFTVGLLRCLYQLRPQYPPPQGGFGDLAKNAIHVQRDLVGQYVGSQAHAIVVRGGLRRLDFSGDDEIMDTPVTIPYARMKEFQDSLVLIFTGFELRAWGIARAQGKSLKKHKQQLESIYQLVEEGVNILQSKSDLCEFGKLLDTAWQLKKELSRKMSSPAVDHVYKKALKNGAVGGKLLGVGGGGFMLLFVKPEMKRVLKAALPGMLEIPFKFEDKGSQIIYRGGL